MSFIIRVENWVLGGSFEIQFFAIILLDFKRKSNRFWNRKKCFYIRVLNLVLGGASKSIFLHYFNWILKGYLIDFEIEKDSFL